MRRLPIYLLIDVSESMVGEPIELVEDGMAEIVKELRTDPYAIETVYLSVVVFAGQTKKMTPFMELSNFYPPKLPIGGGTSLGKALDFLMNDINNEVRRTTIEEKGDWKPIVFLFTDGNPTDEVDSAFERWNRKYRSKAHIIAISLGKNVNTGILGRITDNVLQLNKTDSKSFKRFFKWITASIKTNSMSVNEINTDELKLAPFSDDILTKIEKEMNMPEIIDDNFAVVLGKCQNAERPYLIKYQRDIDDNPYSQYVSKSKKYKLSGAYPVDNTYFELSDSTPLRTTINTNLLNGFPHCPCCGNQYGFSLCRCGRVICVGNEEASKCPWCGFEAYFGFAEGDSDITRTRG